MIYMTPPTTPTPRKRDKGFTLIEVLVAVAIVGILGAFAYPSYTQQVRKSHRSNAEAIMMETAQFMERYYTVNNTYANAALPSAVAPKGATGANVQYNFSFAAGPTAAGYTLQAVPARAQASDPCGTLTLAHTGAQTAATAGCW